MHQTREIFENGKVTNYTGELRHLFETQNQKVCYEWLKSKIIMSVCLYLTKQRSWTRL